MARTVAAMASLAAGIVLVGLTASPDEVTATGLTERPATADAGPSAEVRQVKTSLPALLRRDVAVGRLPVSGVAARTAWVAKHARTADVTARLQSVWATPEVAGRAREWVAALVSAAGDPSYESYDDNRLTVTRWQGVTVSGAAATAVFLGHPSYHLVDRGWTADPDDQYQVALERATGAGPGRWRLVTVERIDDSDLAESGQ